MSHGFIRGSLNQDPKRIVFEVADVWALQAIDSDEEDCVTITDVAAPYWELAVGLVWWCHVAAGHPFVHSWLSSAQWLHSAISIALRDEGRLISERMKHLFNEVPVRVAGGLLFELLGQSVGDPLHEEDDVPVVLRSWQAHNFLVTALHELLAAEGTNMPHTVHEVIAHLTTRLARWDDRCFSFGYLSKQSFTLAVNLYNIESRNQNVINSGYESEAVTPCKRGNHVRASSTRARCLVEGIMKSSTAMIEEQEAVCSRLFTIQDVMQSTVRAWLQDKSLTVTHNLGVFAGGALHPRTVRSAAHWDWLLYLGLKKSIVEEDVLERELELQKLVKMFQQEAECHAQVGKQFLRPTQPLLVGFQIVQIIFSSANSTHAHQMQSVW
ncbi:hypothetical protein TIFTF001_024048 [Ficus carica]|uniref:Uncharacterized protein n=1 Tax=Ficus carica TaxID=3494 RepID=A0AA88ALY8_FICCA|nr:hypothetical protein TIFTF001_024048 [Ficus carica]